MKYNFERPIEENSMDRFKMKSLNSCEMALHSKLVRLKAKAIIGDTTNNYSGIKNCARVSAQNSAN